MDYDYVDWYCDNCDSYLNNQPGFTTETGQWECIECGSINDVTSNNILSEEEAENVYHQECPSCGGHMRRAVIWNLWVCENCGTEAKEDDYGLLWTETDDDDFDHDYEDDYNED